MPSADRHSEPAPSRRGRLRVYLGAAPGVGKTFAMLDEGHRRLERGTDVVVGYVETHDRAKTAERLRGLEVVPRAHLTYRGVEVTELDLAAVLARKPELALVDELAHTNAHDEAHLDAHPTAHTKRWQDVLALLEAGIDVITTVNVQHLESLNDVVESITGIRQNETVPDRIVRSADAVELVDMSPQALQRRMSHGNIYAADKVEHALSNYFREGNLAALRELALLWLADRVDEGLERYRSAHGIESTWATRERVVVAVSGREESLALLRRAARIASRTAGGEWLAVYVTRRDGLSGVSTVQLEKLRSKTAELGGTFHAVVAADVAEGVLDFARGVNATQVLLGASRRSRLSTALRPGIGEIVIAESGEIDVHVVTHDYARQRNGGNPSRAAVGRKRLVIGYLLAVLGTALLAIALSLVPDQLGLPTESMLFMALVIATALVGGLVPAVVGAVLSGVLLNVLFIPPTGTLIIASPENVAAVVVFLVTGVAVATVVDRAARRTEEATRARAEANALAVLSHSLMHSGERADDLLGQVCEMFGMSGGAVLRRDEEGGDDVAGAEAVIGTPGDGPADAEIVVRPGVSVALWGHPLDAADQRLLSAFAAHFAVISERRAAAAEAQRAVELAEGNRTRTALLAAVSHDLRTPLATIKAAISNLRDTDVVFSDADVAELQASIEDSADTLEGLIGNLLNLSRLQMGTVNPLQGETDLTAVVSWAVDTVVDADRVTVAIDPSTPPAQADPGLLDRVIANLVENALHHAPDSEVIISGSTHHDGELCDRVRLHVTDHGPGVAEADLDALFTPFRRFGDVPNGTGLGLGLAVARGLTEAMGGTLTAAETPGGGLTMTIDLAVAHPADAGEGVDPPAAEIAVSKGNPA